MQLHLTMTKVNTISVATCVAGDRGDSFSEAFYFPDLFCSGNSYTFNLFTISSMIMKISALGKYLRRNQV